jgi:hypothetical protein
MFWLILIVRFDLLQNKGKTGIESEQYPFTVSFETLFIEYKK